MGETGNIVNISAFLLREKIFVEVPGRQRVFPTPDYIRRYTMLSTDCQRNLYCCQRRQQTAVRLGKSVIPCALSAGLATLICGCQTEQVDSGISDNTRPPGSILT